MMLARTAPDAAKYKIVCQHYTTCTALLKAEVFVARQKRATLIWPGDGVLIKVRLEKESCQWKKKR